MTLLWSLWLSVAAALSPADLTEANKAYSDGEFSLASQLYVDMIEEGALSGDLYYNLGNSLYREGRPGHAILSWWRALVLQPRDADALANMERVRDELGIVSEIPGRSGPLFINASLSEKEQAWMAAFFWAVLGAVGLLGLRRRSFSWGIPTLLAGVPAVYLSLSVVLSQSAPSLAVVLDGEQSLRSALGGGGVEISRLLEGSIVTIQESSGEYVLVQAGAGQSGWLQIKAVGRVDAASEFPL